MAMRLVRAREIGGEFVLVVHLDETQVDTAGQPLAAWVREWRFSTSAPAGRTRAQYLADCRREVKAAAAEELARRVGPAGGTAIAGEGQVL